MSVSHFCTGNKLKFLLSPFRVGVKQKEFYAK
jgi:hypothetical protein